MNRNAPCACGSGKRYKHCHGRTEPAATIPATATAHIAAMTAHRSGSLGRAEAMYRQAIEDNPADVESLHMLGVVAFQRMRYREALIHLWDAAERIGWTDPVIRTNIGLVLAKLLSPQANARQEALVAAYVARERARKAETAPAVRVSVMLPVHNGARDVVRAIASVAAQTYADIELVVVDDGSTDDTATVVASCLQDFPFPAKVVTLEHQGAAHAANIGAQQAVGRYLAFLGAADTFAPNRIARMASEIARAEPLWGFSRTGAASDRADSGDSGRLRAEGLPSRDFTRDEPASFTLLGHDVAGSSGNLFVERNLFHALGGYRDIAHFRGWDFAVRAAEAVEPVAVDEVLYFHPRDDRAQRPLAQAIDQMARQQVVDALTRDTSVANESCPQFIGNRDLLLRSELRAGRGDQLPVPLLRDLAAAWRTRVAEVQPATRRASTRQHGARTALVVLGPYRSGTSALARVLNLCGATLPERVMPARIGINPTGFWESEAIGDLDARLLDHLGGDWNRVDFILPHGGPLVDEFRADLRELMAAEYGDAPLILVKDPRICVLAPLWQHALTEGGYRPVYVVPVRDPLEIARSMHARGDMPVAQGLVLWLAYMQRVEAFVDTGIEPVVHVRYTALLDDWRRVMRLIADRLGVALAIERRADEIDRFLKAGTRNQKVAESALDSYVAAHLANATGDAIRALHRRSLERCERDSRSQER
jgi:glycosyl transferase family 2/SEC-C motif-containing protein